MLMMPEVLEAIERLRLHLGACCPGPVQWQTATRHNTSSAGKKAAVGVASPGGLANSSTPLEEVAVKVFYIHE